MPTSHTGARARPTRIRNNPLVILVLVMVAEWLRLTRGQPIARVLAFLYAIAALIALLWLRHQPAFINGDGETTRDFCYIDNVVQANLLAALTQNREAVNQIYNVAVGERTTLNELFELLRAPLAAAS